MLKNNIVMRNMRQADRAVETIGSDMWLGLDDLEKSKRTIGARLNHLIDLKVIKEMA